MNTQHGLITAVAAFDVKVHGGFDDTLLLIPCHTDKFSFITADYWIYHQRREPLEFLRFFQVVYFSITNHNTGSRLKGKCVQNIKQLSHFDQSLEQMSSIWETKILHYTSYCDLCQKNRDYVSKMKNLFHCILDNSFQNYVILEKQQSTPIVLRK
jgi:hypothetical protein